MTMVEIRPLARLEPADARRLISGYTSDAKYQPHRSESGGVVTFTLQPVALAEPYIKRWGELDAGILRHYQSLPAAGFSFGVFETGDCVGIALGEPHHWNRSLWVVEFHIAEERRGRGLGRRLMEAAVRQAQLAGMRCVVCETQNTNAPAIAFYRRLGFSLDGIDLSYYSNQDYPDGEIALFLKKYLV